MANKKVSLKSFRGAKIDSSLVESEARKFELYNLSRVEIDILEGSANICRAIKNAALEYKIYMYNQHRISVGFTEMSSEVTKMKKTEGFEWTLFPPATAIQQSIKDLDTAYQNFFKNGKGFPKFTSKNSKSGMSFRLPSEKRCPRKLKRLSKNVWSLSGIPKFKTLKIKSKNNKNFISEIRDDFDISSLTFSRSAGKWFISIGYDRLKRSEIVADEASHVGIDRGVAISYALSNEQSFSLPVDKIKSVESKIAKLQRKTKRQKKKSKNKQKTYTKMAKLHKKIVNIRSAFLHETTTLIAKNHSVVVLEDLKITNMSRSAKGTIDNPGRMVAQKRGLNRAILRQSWGEFDRMLGYKLKRNHGKLIKVPPHHTSNTCSNCGVRDPKSRVSQDHFSCQHCGFEKNADFNAAKIILALGYRDNQNDCGGLSVGSTCEAVTSKKATKVA